MVDGEVYMYLHVDRLPSTTSTTTATSTPAPKLFEEDPGSMTVHLALVDLWKTLLNSSVCPRAVSSNSDV